MTHLEISNNYQLHLDNMPVIFKCRNSINSEIKNGKQCETERSFFPLTLYYNPTMTGVNKWKNGK